MSACTFNVGGKNLTQQEVEEQIKLIGANNFRLSHLSQDMITIEQAKAITKSWLPSAILEGEGSWLKFIPTLINSQMLEPTQNLMAKIADGTIVMESDYNNQVSRTMLTHELIHLAYSHGMSPTWKTRFNKALEEAYGRSLEELLPHQVEHLVARLFERVETPKSKLDRFLDMLKSLFNFFFLNKKDLTTLGKLLASGYFSRPVTNIQMEYTASYSIISKYFHDNVHAYEAAKAWLMNSIYQAMESPSNQLSVTREDAIRVIRGKMGDEKTKVTEFLRKTIEAKEKIQAVINKDIANGIEPTLKRKQLLIAQIEKQNLLEAQILGLNVLTHIPETEKESPIVVQLLKELFPIWSFDQQLINAIVKGFEVEDRYVRADEEDKTTDGLRNETKITEKEDESYKTSNSVKDFLSFIPIINEDRTSGQMLAVSYNNSFSLRNFVPYKYAFARTIEFFTNYIELFNTNTQSFNDVINFIEQKETLNNYSQSLILALEKLFLKASFYPDNTPKHFTVRLYQEPVTKKVYYVAFMSKDLGTDISYKSTNELILSKNDRTSPWHTFQVAANTAVEDMNYKGIMEELYESLSKVDINISKKQFSEVYTHYKAVDTLNELHNHMGSLDERDYFVAIGEWFKGKFNAMYRSLSGTDVKADMKNQLQSALVAAVSTGILKRDTKIKISTNAELYDFLINTLKLDAVINSISFRNSDLQNIESKLNAIRTGIPDIKLGKVSDDTEEIDSQLGNWVTNNSKFLTEIARILIKDDITLSNPSIIDSSGNRTYKNTTSSFGIKTINLLHSVDNAEHKTLHGERIWQGGNLKHDYKASLLPDFLWTPLYSLNAFFQGVNTIKSRVALHDAFYNPYTKKAWIFTRETTKIWWSRNFVFGFLAGLSGDIKTKENKPVDHKQSYRQFFYQPSDKARIAHVEVDVLNPLEVRWGMKLIAEKLHYLHNVEKRNLKYINSSYFDVANNPHTTAFLTSEKNSSEYTKHLGALIEHAYTNVVRNAYNVYDTKVAKYKVGMPEKVGSIFDLFLEGKPLLAIPGQSVDAVREMFALWYLNNMVNGYHLNELTSGNPEYYSKGAIDIVKRQAGVWGPQIKPRVGINGTSEKFLAWVLNDTTIKRDSSNSEEQTIRSFLNSMYQGRGIPEEQMKQEIEDVLDLFEKEGFKMTDGGGFMHPSRWSDLSKGFGTSYRLGNVMKPMHFQIRTSYKESKIFKTETEARNFLAKNRGIYYGNKEGGVNFDPASKRTVLEQDNTKHDEYMIYHAVSEPVYIKYATMVLSDGLLGITPLDSIGKYPVLYQLRKMMESRTDRHGNPVGEIVFASSVKLGAPNKQYLRTVEQIMHAMVGSKAASTILDSSGVALPKDNTSTYLQSIDDRELLELDNRYYGFQFNPTTKALKNVSHPTQLEYLANLLETNRELAKKIYGSIALINEINMQRFKRKLSSFKDVTAYIKSLISSPDTERVQHLLSAGTSINMPTIEMKAITQLISSITKSVIDIKSRGGKLILQGAQGITSLDPETGQPATLIDIANKSINAEALKYTNQDGKTIADAIVPRDMLTKEQIDIIKNGGSVYMLGFRIPSTEIHSMLLLKVHSFYDKVGTNVIIVPKEVLPIHGSDLDVDSLFTMTYEIVNKSTVINNHVFETNTIVGKKASYNAAGKIIDYVDDYEFWSNSIKEELLVSRDEARIDVLQKLQIKLAKNIMLDSFIAIAGDTENVKRMTTPISKEEWTRHKETISGVQSGLQVLADRGLTQYDPDLSNPFESIWDLTKAEDSSESHESINEGMQLTGVFANNLKVLSILTKSKLGSFNIAQRYNIKWDSFSDGIVNLLNIRDINFNLKSGLTWQTLDSLINLAIDNAKDQVLNKFYINSKNANLTSMLFGLGLTVPEFALLTGTSLWRRASSDEFAKFTDGLLTLAESTKHGRKLFSNILLAKKQDLKLKTDANKEAIYKTVLSFDKLDKFISYEKVPPTTDAQKEEFEDIKIAILDLLFTNYLLGQHVKSMSESLQSLRDVDTDIETLEIMYSKIVRTFGLKPTSSVNIQDEDILELTNDELELKELDPIQTPKEKISLSAYQLNTSDTLDFVNNTGSRMPRLKDTATERAFDISNIFQENPHIFTAFRNVEFILSLIKENWLIHSNKLDGLASFKIGFKLNRNISSHKIAVKRELSKFLLTNDAARKVFQDWTKGVSLKKWVDTFKTDLDNLKKFEKRLSQDPDKKLNGYRPNTFLNFITVGYSQHTTSSGKKSSRKTVKIHSGLDISPSDIYYAIKGFEDLSRFYKDESGKWGYREDIAPARDLSGFNTLQHELLLYNILTAGMAYGSSNYSIFIPPQIYKELQDKFEDSLKALGNNFNDLSKLTSSKNVSNEEIAKIKEGLLKSFFMKLAVDNLTKVGRIKVEKDEDKKFISDIVLVQNKPLEGIPADKDTSINRGVHIVDGVPFFYDVSYQIRTDYEAEMAKLDDIYKESNSIIEEDIAQEDNEFDKDLDAETNEQEGLKKVWFPTFLRKGVSAYIVTGVNKNRVYYQRVGDEISAETSLLPMPLAYDFDYYFNPNYRTILVKDISINFYDRTQFNLNYELETGRPFRLVDMSNIYRLNERWVKADSYSFKDLTYKLSDAIAPIHPTLSQTTEEFTEFVEVTPAKPQLPPGPVGPVTQYGLSAGTSSMLEKIKKEGEEYKDTFEDVEHEGSITRRYQKGEGINKIVVTRLTDGVLGLFNAYFKRNPYKLLRNQAIHAKALELWKDKDPSEKLTLPQIAKAPINMDEYETKRKETSNRWINIGTAGHLLLQAYINLLNNKVDKYEEFVERARNLVGEDEFSLISWILNQDSSKQTYAKLILEKSGVNLQTDTIASEVRIGSKIWGFGSTIDMLIEHVDKTMSIVDFKFGRFFNSASSSFLMNYSIGQHEIRESPKEVAKLEVMLRAMMLKTEYPELRFKNLMIQWTPSKDHISYQDAGRFVEVKAYINMIRANLKQEYTNAKTQAEKDATIYGKLMTLPHFESIFTPSEYYAGYSEQPLNKKIQVEGTPEVRLKYYMEELRKNILWDLNPNVKTDRDNPKSSVKRTRLAKATELTNAILELKKTELSNIKWDENLSWLSLYLGSNRDIDNAYISIYSKILDEANHKAHTRFSVIEQLYKVYLKYMVEDYYKRKGVTKPPVIAGQQDRAGFWTNINPTEFWEAFFKYDDTGKNILQVNVTDQDWAEASERFRYLKDSNVMKNHRNMAQFMNDNYKGFFVDSFSHYGQAMANRPATWRMDEGKERVVSDLELHLNPQPALAGRKREWQFKDGWFPKLGITTDELGWLAQIPIIRVFSKEYRKNAGQRLTVNYTESELLQERNTDEAIPWRYLGNAQIEGSQEFSKNLEHVFLSFMKYHILKEERTDVFAFGRGLMEKAKASEDEWGANLGNVIEYLDKALKMHVQGLRQVDFQGGLFNKDIPLIRTINGRAERPDWVKIIRAIKTSSAGPIMLLKPFQGAANFVFISLYTLKEGIKDSIIKGVKDNKFLGVDSDFTSFTTQDLTEAWVKDYSAFLKDSATGNLHKNKLWTLAKKLNYIPDAYDIYLDSNRKSITRGRIFDQSTMYMFHSAPEEAMAMVIMSTQMRHMKINSKDARYAGKSLWDMYEMKEVLDPKTGQKYWDAVWKDGYIRGYTNTAPAGVEPNYKPLTELDSNELRRMKYVYQRMHGGYRSDEKTYLEYFVLGEMLLQFKRYLPTLLRNYGQSRAKIDSYGMYKPKMENGQVVMKDGVEVVEWVSRMVEGRAKVLAGFFMQAMGVRHKVGDNLTLKDKLLTAIGFEGLESYSWKALDSSSREILIDFAVTMSMVGLVFAVYVGMGGGGGNDDKDPWLKFVSRIYKNLGQQYNVLEVIREVKELGLPSTAKVSWYRASALADLVSSTFYLSIGDEDKAFTKQGTMRGTNQFIKYWMPYGGSYYDFVRLILGEENVDEFTLSPDNIRK